MKRRPLLAVILILAMGIAAIPLANGAPSQPPALSEGATISGSLTHVYNMLYYDLQSIGLPGLTSVVNVQGSNLLAVAAGGKYAVLKLDTATRTLSLVTIGSLVGDNRIAFTDSLSAPSWIGFGQTSGEVLLVNTSNPLYTLSYYTATRSGVKEAVLTKAGGERLAVRDEDGFIYIYRVGEPYWLEIGPGLNGGALASLPYFNGISNLVPQTLIATDGSQHSGSIAAAKVSSIYYTGQIAFSATYYDPVNKTYLPALTASIPINNTTVKVTNLYAALATNSSGIVVSLEPMGGATNSYITQPVPAGIYDLILVFNYQIVNVTSGEVLKEYYYVYAKKNIVVPPLGTVNIGSIALTSYSVGNVDPTQELQALGYYYPQGEKLVWLLALNLETLNETTIYGQPMPGAALWMTPIVLPVSAEVSWIRIYKPAAHPKTWPTGATTLLLVGSNTTGSVYIVFTDDNLTVIPNNKTGNMYEAVLLGAAPVPTPVVSSDASEIYLGASSGYVLQLVWLPDYGKYVAAHSYQLDTTPVSSLIYDNGNRLLLAASKGGVLQLIDTTGWIPLWRGIPGYTGVETMMSNYKAAAFSLDYIVGYSQGNPTLYIMYQPVRPLVPLMINLTITLATYTGNTTTVNAPKGTTAVLINGTTPVAVYRVEEGQQANATSIVFYVPAGNHTLNLTMPGIGGLVKNYTVPSTGIEDVIHVGLRQVPVRAYTPSSIGDPRRDPGYYLVSGPKPGVQVRADPYAYATQLGYTPIPPTATGVTDSNGIALLTLWQGVVYQVTGSLTNYTSGVSYTSLNSTSMVNLTMNPILYKTSFYIYDADTAGSGTPMYLSTVAITLALTGTGKSVNLTVNGGGDYYYLPAGQYIVTARAPHYVPGQTGFTVAGATQVQIPLQAKTYTLTLSVYSSDPTGLNIGNGPLQGAQVNVTMVWPVPGLVRSTVYTGPDGKAVFSLRYGIYRITITHPYTENASTSMTIGNNVTATRSLTLKVSEVTLYFKDAQFTLAGVTNVSIQVSYLGGSWNNTISLNTGNKSIITVSLPYGSYKIRASAKYYQDYVERTVISRPSLLKYVYMQPAMSTVTVQVLYSPAAGNLTQGPIQGALVALKLRYPNIPVGNISAVTDSNGVATFYVRQGIYDIVVTSPYIRPIIDKNVEVVSDQVIGEQAYPVYGNISVRAVDAESGATIPGATLVIARSGPGVEASITITLSSGTASLRLPAGVYTLTTTYTGRYASSTAQLDLRGGAQEALVFPMTPLKSVLTFNVESSPVNATIGGHTLELPSTPVVNATITLIPMDSLLQAVYNKTITAVTGPDGQAVLGEVRTGTYRVVVEADGYVAYETTLTVEAESSLNLPVNLEPYLVNFTITPLDEGLRNPVVTPVTVSILQYNGQAISSKFTLEAPINVSLPTGVYLISIAKDRYIPANLTLTVKPGLQAVNVTMNPVIVVVPVQVSAKTVFGTGAVLNGSLLLMPKDWDLRESPIRVNITGGSATAALRLGTYEAYLYSPLTGEKVPAGTVEVKSDTGSLKLTVKPPAYNVTIELRDSDLAGPIVGGATVTLQYRGPYGSGSISVNAVNATAEAQVPAGLYQIQVASEYYKLYVLDHKIRGSGKIVIVLTPVRVNATLNLVDIDNNPVTASNVTVSFVHQLTGEITTGVLINGKIVPIRGLRLGTYKVTIIPPETAPINTTTTIITVTPSGVSPQTIVALPRIYTLNITLYDPVAKGPAKVQSFTITITRSGNPATQYGLPITVTTNNGTVSVRVPYGLYTITVKGGEKSYFKDPAPITKLIASNTNLTIRLQPLVFTGQVVVTDDRGMPLQGALVRVTNASGRLVATGVTDANGMFVFRGVYGPYTAQVTAKGFKSGIGVLNLPNQPQTTVKLKPTPATVLKRYSPLFVGIIGIILLGGILYVARGKIMEKLSEEEEYF